jgi:hypothetical protein
VEAVVLFVAIVDPLLLLIITCQELRNPRGPYSMTCINMICIAAAWPCSSAQNRPTPFLIYRLHWTFRNASFHFFKEPPGWSEGWYFKILDKKLEIVWLHSAAAFRSAAFWKSQSTSRSRTCFNAASRFSSSRTSSLYSALDPVLTSKAAVIVGTNSIPETKVPHRNAK